MKIALRGSLPDCKSERERKEPETFVIKSLLPPLFPQQKRSGRKPRLKRIFFLFLFACSSPLPLITALRRGEQRGKRFFFFFLLLLCPLVSGLLLSQPSLSSLLLLPHGLDIQKAASISMEGGRGEGKELEGESADWQPNGPHEY